MVHNGSVQHFKETAISLYPEPDQIILIISHAQHHIKIDKKTITLSETLKALGSYEIEIKLYAEASAKITVEVLAAT